MLEAARAAAEEALIEQRIIMADPQAYQEFLARLDQTPSPNAALRKTMQTPAPWEQENDLLLSRFMPDIFLLRFAAVWILWITG